MIFLVEPANIGAPPVSLGALLAGLIELRPQVELYGYRARWRGEAEFCLKGWRGNMPATPTFPAGCTSKL